MSHPSPPRSACYSGADEGRLVHLAHSVGLPALPLTPAAQATEQAKKQKVITQAHGNANQPSPLPPAKRHKACDNVPLLDHRIEDLTTEEDCVEWLLQVIDNFGYPKYQQDPKWHDSEILYEVYKVVMRGENPKDYDEEDEDVAMLALAPTPDPPVRTGLTRVLEHHKSGHWPIAKLTLLSSLRINAGHNMEYGLLVASAKLTRTDQATLSPDGVCWNAATNSKVNSTWHELGLNASYWCPMFHGDVHVTVETVTRVSYAICPVPVWSPLYGIDTDMLPSYEEAMDLL
ncbi:hypothetical protein FRC10_010744 [Ceratobasidium sp. 414]|nr:hypothetical protein FRC10_010744 [Ceratobasidium sp. 414]